MHFPLILTATYCAIVSSAAGAALQCEPSKRPYSIEDEAYCDKYFVCDDGKAAEQWCDDGLVFDPKKETCDLPHTVNCGLRTKLQTPKPTVNCPRRNGMFEVEGSCDQFSHCTDGQHTLIRCPPGIIFSPEVGSCVHPDQTSRPNCAANAVLNFKCPDALGSSLRFGDHDRLPHPTDCRYFYMCLLSGQPRLGGCSIGLVFNPIHGRCDRPKNVPGCENFYGDMDEDDDDLDVLESLASAPPPSGSKASRTSAAPRKTPLRPSRPQSPEMADSN